MNDNENEKVIFLGYSEFKRRNFAVAHRGLINRGRESIRDFFLIRFCSILERLKEQEGSRFFFFFSLIYLFIVYFIIL